MVLLVHYTLEWYDLGTMKPRRVNVRGIIWKDGKLLVATFIQNDGTEGKYWGTFGGGLDDNESLEEGLKREMIEETGIAPKIGKLLFIQQFKSERRDHQEELEFFFHIENPEDYEDFAFENTTHGAVEMSRHEFVDPSTRQVLPAFLQTIDIESYIKEDKPVYIANLLD